MGNPETHISGLSNFLGSSTLKAEDLMPAGIMSPEPRHDMVFGQLVVAVQCLGLDGIISLGIKSSATKGYKGPRTEDHPEAVKRK